MVIALRSAADELEKKLFLQTHREQTRREQLKTIRDWDWLTPEMVIKYFEKSPILRPVADDVKAVLSKAWPTPEAKAAPAPSQLDLDLQTILPHLDRIRPNGRIIKSEIARLLNLPTGGSQWGRVAAAAEALSLSLEQTEPNAAQGDGKEAEAA